MQPYTAPVVCKRYTQLHYTNKVVHIMVHYIIDKILFPLDFHFQILNVKLTLYHSFEMVQQNPTSCIKFALHHSHGNTIHWMSSLTTNLGNTVHCLMTPAHWMLKRLSRGKMRRQWTHWSCKFICYRITFCRAASVSAFSV